MSVHGASVQDVPPPTLDEQARSRLRAWIVATGVTQAALAEQIGRTQAWMSRYLSGEIDADLETLNKLARAFDHTLTALLDLPSNPDDARLIEQVHRLSPKRRALIRALVDDLTQGRLPRGR